MAGAGEEKNMTLKYTSNKKKMIRGRLYRTVIAIDVILLALLLGVFMFSGNARKAGKEALLDFASIFRKNEPSAGTDPAANTGTGTGGATTTAENGIYATGSVAVSVAASSLTASPARPSHSYDSSYIASKKLDTAALDLIDNTRYDWWIRLNNENRPTEINPDIEKILEDSGSYYLGDTTRKIVYLTFDQGYEQGYTPMILDTLRDNNVKAAFFITGDYISSRPDLVLRMADEGHIVGNHTVNHKDLTAISYETFEYEFNRLEDDFYKLTGQTFKYMRPPSGTYSIRALEAARQLGYVTVFWSYAYDDWVTTVIRGPGYAYDKVMKNLHNGAVILLHAVSKDNAEALDLIIRDIKALGYEFKLINF